jgi:hypothetical protein
MGLLPVIALLAFAPTLAYGSLSAPGAARIKRVAAVHPVLPRESSLLARKGASVMHIYTITPQPQRARRKASGPAPSLSAFSMDGDASLLEEADLGIINGLLTTNVTFRDVLSFRGLYAPPYASSDFALEVRVCGEKVATRSYRWHPFCVERKGSIQGVGVSSSLVLCAGKRAAVLVMTFDNRARAAKRLPVQFNIRGGLDHVSSWEFGRPNAVSETVTVSEKNRLTKRNDAGAIFIGADLDNPKWEAFSSHWETQIGLAARERRTHYVCASIGDREAAGRDCDAILKNPQDAVDGARRQWSQEISDLFAKLPRLECADQRLERFYNRSLLHLLLNRWQVPEFLLHPYYSTGSVNGGCVCSYLWDFGEAWEVLPLYDPEADREHIKRFLSIDLTSHFAFSPISGEAFGPWYPVNQEKIVRSIYYYVLFTGDVGFLEDTVAGKTVLDWVIHHATHGDDVTRPVALIDYGNGNHHLELRGKYRYDNYLPDLNGRRYDSYVAAYHLSRLAGRPAPYLLERAAALKRLLRERMWSPQQRWFFHLGPDLTRQLRYTVQMFKLVGSEVLDAEEEAGLLRHLNEREFLSAYGLHSMSKRDEAYDQADIDNGGGGSYVSFPPQIIERLYKAGHPEIAEDILKRILWWGERLPYWGDSQVANNMDYRKDTPLQCSIGAVAGAQCVIFGMFGVAVNPNGDIVVNPHPPAFSPEMRLTGLRIRGCSMDIRANRKTYEIVVNGKVITSPTGVPVVLRPAV